MKHKFTVGQDVSRGFNGDWYPCGKVERFTKSGKYLYTTTGHKFTLKTHQESMLSLNLETNKYEWVDTTIEYFKETGSCFILALGVIQELNPEF